MCRRVSACQQIVRVCGGFRGIDGNRVNKSVGPVSGLVDEDISLNHEETKPSLLCIREKISDLVCARFFYSKKPQI